MDVAARVGIVGWRIVVMGVALLAALSGCAGDLERAPTLPPLTVTPSASPSAQPTPTGIDAPTPEGATAFARYWYAQLEVAYVRKDASLVEDLSAEGCNACRAFTESIRQLERDGGRVEGLAFRLRIAEPRLVERDIALVDVVYDAPETVSYDAAGTVDLREPAVMFAEESMQLVRNSSSWLVAQVEPV